MNGEKSKPHETDGTHPYTATRRRFVGTMVAGGLAASGATALTARSVAGRGGFARGASIRLKPVATGLDSPLAFAVADDGSERAFVVNQNGVVNVIDPDRGGVTGTFIDIGGKLDDDTGEEGLLGIAFHPEFSSNRRFFLRYSAPSRSDTPSEFDHTEVLSEFQASSDGNQGKLGTERTVLEIPHPQANHNGGAITFGPDGYLYMGMGDGGGGSGDAGTGHADDWYGKNDGGNGQDIETNLLGSVLRLDVDGRDGNKAYAIPDDNPRVGKRGLPEHYAWGFRNPFKLSFDSRGRLFVADVGQSDYEEVDIVEKGGNYGWNVREGRHCYTAGSCPDTVRNGPRRGEPLEDPIVEYSHSVGNAITGGYVYAEDTVGALEGAYVFGDYASRKLFAATETRTEWTTEELVVAGTDDGTAPGSVRGFGRDESGELYVVTGSTVLKIVPDFESRDPDGDDRYEDINGDGDIDTVDVQRLFVRRDSMAVRNNQGAFDFNDDGSVDVVDIQRLFVEQTR